MKRVHTWMSAQLICLQLVAFAIVHDILRLREAHATQLLSPAGVLDRPAMSLSPAELQAAATSLPVPEGEGQLTVGRQIRYGFDGQGRSIASWRGVVRMVTSTGRALSAHSRRSGLPGTRSDRRFARASSAVTAGFI